jgi:hypothetical protein
VTALAPLNNATGVALNTAITAQFDEAMTPATMNASTFTLTTGSGGTSVGGAVTYNSATNIVTLTPTSYLASGTPYSATITNGVTNLSGTAMAANFGWTFKTGAAPAVTPPTVISTIPVTETPPATATDVPVNQVITATFSEAMNDTTINTGTFTLTYAPTPTTVQTVQGVVSYIAGSNTAIFTPTSNLAANTTYTATVTKGVADLAGNNMVNNYVWNFTTAAAAVSTPPTVVSTTPTGTAVCYNATIGATFSMAMNATTFNATTFAVTAPSGPVTGIFSLDLTGTIITFTPASNLAPSTIYTVTMITPGVTDLAGIPLVGPYSWSFTTVASACLAPPPLGAATPFGSFGGNAGMTNEGIYTVINGDIGTTGASSTVTGFHDITEPYIQFSAGCIYTETTLNVGTVNGKIYTAPGTSIPTLTCPNEGTAATMAIATQAAADALSAYNALVALPPGSSCPGAGNGAGLTLASGTYTCASTFKITGGDLTLDAGGNTNAVWVFQVGSALTVGDTVARNVILINGAQAANVFWQVGSSAVINYAGGGTMVGTIIANAGVTLSSPANSTNATPTVLNGRALGLGASTTLVNTVINVPGQ